MGLIMNKKLIAAAAPLALALPLARAGPASAMPAPGHGSHPTQLTCEIKASPVKVFRGPALIKWKAVVAKKHSHDKVLIQMFANGVTRDQRGTDVLKVTAYDPSTHQVCVDIAVVRAHR